MLYTRVCMYAGTTCVCLYAGHTFIVAVTHSICTGAYVMYIAAALSVGIHKRMTDWGGSTHVVPLQSVCQSVSMVPAMHGIECIHACADRRKLIAGASFVRRDAAAAGAIPGAVSVRDRLPDHE